ncbi:MAG: hypothetical protein HFI93_01235 [Lachnospiraceae bacterium]|nr:hypothetical protein [Lachnospiraceae bacterium]
MKKRILKRMFVVAVLALLLPVRALAADTGDQVRIGEAGEVTVVSDHAGREGISSLQLSLTVEPESPGAGVSFSFADTSAKIAEYRYHEDNHTLNLYLAGTEALFDENGSLMLGMVSVRDGEGNAVPAAIRVQEDSLKYVYGTEVKSMSVDSEPTSGEDDSENESTPAPGPRPEVEEKLLKTLETAGTFAAEDYTEASYRVLKEAIAEAEALLRDPNRTEEQMEEALRNLENAIGALEPSSRVSGPGAGNQNPGGNGGGPSTAGSANTGDQTKILPYVFMLAAGGCVVIGLLVAERRRRSRLAARRRRRSR